ncbi:LysM peptidoglycan-binding domain-containing protein [Mycobacteroides abscessus]|uniref:LysM peptidoglycan-binding domain-containing protein n=1 Tax=Mycobacteroides abscessus TaxID=36809 RepID=UPI0009259445|nr:LysM peptidoglycan-binding domain-containing protein [Mycobacteroides abscessus]MDO2970438.1 LysM peptidoglycan-binding domain-containing protein [Mycobacteroides abscessus subsp. bolletii]MDO3077823.1 LysM peptidoglycan-binding domain-containing protein [Mycobacteroides abscessus subsp. bolletii]MDO3334362.1 LysM peptidoglycan-binding domain-containing protein [Mycobacteroides abscessus subsp. bolletii]QSM87312.1 LysM peptidoglycan-binding domain-containing protein [Mycobacteroides abscessu
MSTNVLTPPRSSHAREGAPREYAPPARAYSAEYPLTQRRALPVRTVAYRRPAGRPVAYRGNGIRVSGVAHRVYRRRPVSLKATIVVAVGAAVATMWLLMLGQVSAAGIGGAGVPDRLAVVQVAPGETLADVASRVAPEAPRSAMVSKIRELNELDSATVQAGQTLVSPVG